MQHIFAIKLRDSSYRDVYTNREESYVDPDQLASESTLFSEQEISGLSMEMVKF